MKKQMKLLLLAALLSVGMACSAQAEESEAKAITSISLSFSWDRAPKAGELVGEVYANTSSNQFIVEGAEYVKKDDTWIYGEQPIVEVELSAEDGYYFSDTSRSRFTLSGCNAQYKTAEIDSDGNSLTLQVSLSKIGGSLPRTTAISWNGNIASWDAVEGSSRYEVRLYCDNRLLTTVTTADNSYDFSAYINTEGTYTFAVQAAGSSSSQDSSWNTESEGRILTREDAWTIDNGAWKQSGSRWRFVYGNGAYPTNSWRLINEKWYYFDSDGCMVSNCYVKSAASGVYYWIGGDGVWNTQWDTENPDLRMYKTY